MQALRVIAWHFVVALFLLTGKASLAAESVANGRELVHLRFETLGTKEGLSQNTVTSITQDSAGFLWIGTENGLNKFDGYRFTNYYRARSDVGGLRSDFIWKIVEDKSRDMWLATEGSGLVRWKRTTDQFTSFQHHPDNTNSLSSDIARSLLLDRRGRLWVGTRGHGLDLVDPETGSVERLTDRENLKAFLTGRSVNDLLESADGAIWVATDSGLLRLAPDARGTPVHYGTRALAESARLSGDEVTALAEDRLGALWVGTAGGGVNRIEHARGSVDTFKSKPTDATSLSDNRAQTIYEDDAGRIWIGTVNGLNLFQRQTGTFRRFMANSSTPDGLRGGDILSISQDRSGMLWIGTRTAGLQKWNPRSWSLGHYQVAPSGEATISSFAPSTDGFIWIGTVELGLLRFDPGTGAVVPAKILPGFPDLNDLSVMSLLTARDGRLWIGTMNGGVKIVNGRNGQLQSLNSASAKNAIGADGIMSLHEDSAGRIWVGTFGGGFSVHEADGKLLHSSEQDKTSAMVQARVTAIEEDADGNIWLGTDGSGLTVLSATFKVLATHRASATGSGSLSSDSVYDIHADSMGRVWVGTAGGGMDLVPSPGSPGGTAKIRNYSRAEGLSSNVVYGIHDDTAGRLWLSTNSGLIRFDPQNAAIAAFHRDHGAQDDEFNFGAHGQFGDGQVVFGGNHGLNLFRPSDVQESHYIAPIVLTGFEKLNAPVTGVGSLERLRSIALSHTDDLVTLQFAALDFTAPTKNRYAYKLEGRDHDWIELGQSNRVTLIQPADGKFKLLVRATTNDRTESEPGLTLDLAIAPPPWRAAWAYAAYVLLALAVIGWLIWYLRRRVQYAEAYRTRLEMEVEHRTIELQSTNEKLASANRAKSEFLARMSHEVRTPINGVLGMAELLIRGELNGAEKRSARLIHTSARNLLAFVDDILDFSKAESGKLRLDATPTDVASLVLEVCEVMSARLVEKGVAFHCHVDSAVPGLVLADAVRVRQVVTNLLSNAVKFTAHGSVGIAVHVAGSVAESVRLRIEISDTGIGISPEFRKRMFESFSQAETSTSRRFGGSGLGLAICRELVELMQGSIGVESLSSGGTLAWFEFSVPVLSSPVIEIERPAAAHALKHFAPLGLNVLVVEDDAVNQEVVTGFLRHLGCSMTLAANGDEAVSAFGSTRYDAVLMDCHLPGQDGFAVTRTLRKMEQGDASTLMVAVTADARAQVEARCIEAGLDEYLGKPLDIGQLHDVLTRAKIQHGQGVMDPTVLASLDRMTSPGANSLGDRVAALYVESSNQQVMVLREAIHSSDFAAVRSIAHALKSASKNVGAQRIADLCAKLEIQADAKQTAELPSLLLELVAQHAATIDWLKTRRRAAA